MLELDTRKRILETCKRNTVVFRRRTDVRSIYYQDSCCIERPTFALRARQVLQAKPMRRRLLGISLSPFGSPASTSYLFGVMSIDMN